MNNTIMIKNADFSGISDKKLNIQKLVVTKAGNGLKKAVDGVVVNVDTNSSANYYPTQIGAYSEEIPLPSGAKYLYGATSIIMKTSDLDSYLANGSLDGSPNTTFMIWLYYDTISGQWKNCRRIIAYNNTINILSRKDVILDGTYSCIKFIGSIYGSKNFDPNLNISKIIACWVRSDSDTLGECGILVPELYVGF